VSPTGGVLSQQYITRTKASHRAIASLNLCLAGQRNHVLTPGRRVPVLDVADRGSAKGDAGSGLKLCRLCGPHWPEFHLYFLEVGLSVVSRIYSNNLHSLALVEKLREKSNRNGPTNYLRILGCDTEDA
jgi:hypothetical protein